MMADNGLEYAAVHTYLAFRKISRLRVSLSPIDSMPAWQSIVIVSTETELALILSSDAD